MSNFVNITLIKTSNKDPQNKLLKEIIYDFTVSLLLNIKTYTILFNLLYRILLHFKIITQNNLI